jgi:hypothetical protein
MSDLQELTYNVQSSHEKGKTLSLLKDVTGYFLPQQMAALVGTCSRRLCSPSLGNLRKAGSVHQGCMRFARLATTSTAQGSRDLLLWGSAAGRGTAALCSSRNSRENLFPSSLP